MNSVVVELTEMLARAEKDAVESTLEPVQPGERVVGELDFQCRTVYAAQQVAWMSLQAYVKGLGIVRPDGVLIFSKHTTSEQIKQAALLKTKFNLLHALFMYLLTKMLSGADLSRNMEVRQGYILVDASNSQNEALLAQAEEDLRAGKSRLQ